MTFVSLINFTFTFHLLLELFFKNRKTKKYMSVSVRHQGDVHDLRDLLPGGEQLSCEERATRTTQRLIVKVDCHRSCCCRNGHQGTDS